jgi:hypothetical protein
LAFNHDIIASSKTVRLFLMDAEYNLKRRSLAPVGTAILKSIIPFKDGSYFLRPGALEW